MNTDVINWMGIPIQKDHLDTLRFKPEFWRKRFAHSLSSILWEREFPSDPVRRMSHPYSIFYWYFEKRIQEYVSQKDQKEAKDERKPPTTLSPSMR